MSLHVWRHFLLICSFAQHKGLISAGGVIKILRAARIAAECHVSLALLVVHVIQLQKSFIINI